MDKRDEVDPGLKQIHLYVCMMIELGGYAMTDKTRQVFQLCKDALNESTGYFPPARSVVKLYLSVPDQHSMPAALCKTQYTDEYVRDINEIITEIMLKDEPEAIKAAFQQTNILE